LSNGRSKSLNSGGSISGGSLTYIVIVALVVIVLVLCAGIYLLYNQNNTNSRNSQNAQQAFTTLNNTYNQLSNQYSTLVTSDAELTQRYNALNVSFSNATSSYSQLKNQSDTTVAELGNLMESGPAIAWRYTNVVNSSSNDTVSGVTGMDTVVTVYNIGSVDVSNVIVTCTFQSISNNSSTGQLIQTIPELQSLNKSTVSFNLDNTTRVQSVYAAITGSN
jgi:hypothetical protein